MRGIGEDAVVDVGVLDDGVPVVPFAVEDECDAEDGGEGEDCGERREEGEREAEGGRGWHGSRV